MKTAKITLNPPEIRSISYNNTFRQKPGQPLKMTIKSQATVKTNPAAPTTAMVFVKITASDEAEGPVPSHYNDGGQREDSQSHCHSGAESAPSHPTA